MLPRKSWVSRWNDLQTAIPGCYAVKVQRLADEESEEDDGSERGVSPEGSYD
jgi:hypothetical protein